MNAKKVRNKAFHNLCKLLDHSTFNIKDNDLPNFLKAIDDDYQTIFNDEQLFSIKKKKIEVKIESLKDLIDLCDEYPLYDDIEYNINMKSIHAIKEPLIELNDMIGMERLKKSILDQILYFIQKFNKDDYMHTVIYGSPGTGKTEIAKIMGKIFSELGCLKNKKFKKVVRADLIAGYLGQTAIKTSEVINSCLGGVLFIDEAYALGHPNKRDSFSKECIDTLCEALSNHKKDLMVIIAGYEKDLETCFFGYNSGLNSRFTWRYKTSDYTPEEIKHIFKKKVKEADWRFEKKIKTAWFKKNAKHFKHFGRDMETLFSKIKIAHARRVFCLDECEKRNISMEDMDNGLKMFLENNGEKKEKSEMLHSLYC